MFPAPIFIKPDASHFCNPIAKRICNLITSRKFEEAETAIADYSTLNTQLSFHIYYLKIYLKFIKTQNYDTFFIFVMKHSKTCKNTLLKLILLNNAGYYQCHHVKNCALAKTFYDLVVSQTNHPEIIGIALYNLALIQPYVQEKKILFRRAIELKNTQAMLALGDWYNHEFDPVPFLMNTYLFMALDHGNIDVYVYMAKKETNYPAMLQWFNKARQHNDPNADYELGMFYYNAYVNSLLITKDERISQCFMFSINKYQHIPSMVALGEYYERFNREQAREFYEMACLNYSHEFSYSQQYNLISANAGNVEAMYRVGVYHQSQNEYDIVYLELSANKGHVKAMLELVKYFKRINKPDKILKYLVMATKHHNIPAMLELAKIANPAKYYIMAIQNGHFEAIELAKKACPQIWDYHFYKPASNQGHVESMFELGKIHESRNEYEQMQKYYSMAIEKGHAGASVNLAKHYIHVCNRKQEGIQILKKTVTREFHRDAVFELALYYEQQANFKIAKQYYLEILDTNPKDDQTAFALGSYYERIEQNYDLMKKYYYQAINYGNTNAFERLRIYYRNIEGDDSMHLC